MQKRLGHHDSMVKPALGRGLGALLGSNPNKAAAPTPASAQEQIPAGERVQRVPTSQVQPCPFQPRKDFTPDAINELADSIKEQGIIQPLIVRQKGEQFELIAGERRWRAAQQAGLKELPVIVRNASDQEVLELALIENLQRENLNAIEEANGYFQLIESFKLTQEQASQKVGKSRTVVANALRLLRLAPEAKQAVRVGTLSVGHAKVILGLEMVQDQKKALAKITSEGLSVRQTEEFVAVWNKPKPPASNPTGAPLKKDLHVADIENKLQQRFGTKVQLRYRQGKGSIDIRFFNDDDLERILKISGVQVD